MAALIARAQQQRADAISGLAQSLEGKPLQTTVRMIVEATLAGEAHRPRLAAALDHEELRLPVSDIVEQACHTIDRALATLLAPHLPGLSEDEREAACRTLRVAIRAIVDDGQRHAGTSMDVLGRQLRHLVIGFLREVPAASRD
jgi:hypothetical protein